MRLVALITLFSSASALVLQPLITPAPQIAIRDAAPNICGYYSLSGIINTISCSVGTPCLVATDRSPAVGYCSRTDNVPVTSIYPYGSWPSNEGCGSGSACCPLSAPSFGKYLFNGGSTVFLGCGLTPFTYNAFFSAQGTPTTTSTRGNAAFTTPGETTEFASASGVPASPVRETTATPVTPVPTQTGSSTGFSSTTTITVAVVGAVVALVGGLVFLWFLIVAWKIHHKAKYPQPQYSPLAYQNSNTSFHSMPPVKKSGLGRWAKIATIVSPIFAIVGLIVAIYFGLKQK